MITLENVRFGYRKARPLFSDTTMTMERGHIYGLLGSNGVGKTTLLKLIAGLLAPQHGTVAVLGQTPSLRQPSLYRQMFVIPEEFEMPPVRLRTFVGMNAPFYPRFSEADLQRYCTILEVDPEVRLDALSMGQKKRAFLAFALSCNTALLIMDEPTNGLDIPSKAAFRRLISGYADEERTVLISTHQVRDVDSLIDSVIVLDRQGVLLNETVERIAARLCFGPVDRDDNPLYAEEAVQGFTGVTENVTEAESRVDLELLFNATVHSSDRITQIFNR